MEKSMIATLLEAQLVERRKKKVDFIYSQIQTKEASLIWRRRMRAQQFQTFLYLSRDYGSMGTGLNGWGEVKPDFKL